MVVVVVVVYSSGCDGCMLLGAGLCGVVVVVVFFFTAVLALLLGAADFDDVDMARTCHNSGGVVDLLCPRPLEAVCVCYGLCRAGIEHGLEAVLVAGSCGRLGKPGLLRGRGAVAGARGDYGGGHCAQQQHVVRTACGGAGRFWRAGRAVMGCRLEQLRKMQVVAKKLERAN